MKKLFLSFLSLFSKKENAHQKVEEPHPEVLSSSQGKSSFKEDVSHDHQTTDVTSDPSIFLKGIEVLTTALGSSVLNYRFTADKNISVWFVSVRVNISLSRHYYLNLVIYPELSEGMEVTKNNSSQRDVKVSKSFLLNQTQALIAEFSEAYSTRMKGYRAEKRFKLLLESCLKDLKKDDYVISYSSDADKRGVDIAVKHKKGREKNFYFQVKSSDMKLTNEFYRDEKIHKIIVNETREDKEIKEQIKSILGKSNYSKKVSSLTN